MPVAVDGRGRGLTGREVFVLKHLAIGHSSRASAGLLGLSPRSVDGHRRRLSVELGRPSAAELTRYAIAAGLFDAGSRLSPPGRPVSAECGESTRRPDFGQGISAARHQAIHWVARR